MSWVFYYNKKHKKGHVIKCLLLPRAAGSSEILLCSRLRGEGLGGSSRAPLGSAVCCLLMEWKSHELAHFAISDGVLLVCFPVCVLHVKSALKDGDTAPPEPPRWEGVGRTASVHAVLGSLLRD